MNGTVNQNDIVSKVRYEFRYRSDANLLFHWFSGNTIRLDNQVSVDIATEIFCNGADTINAVASIISSEYDISIEECATDVKEFLANTIYADPAPMEGWDSLEKGRQEDIDFPLRVEFELTSLCNWQCGFCYNVWKIDSKLSDREVLMKSRELRTKNMAKEDVFRLLDECDQNNTFIVRYSGGETMLNPDFYEIIEYGAKKRLYQVVFTNGHFFDAVAAESFVKNNVKEVMISLHGTKDVHVELTKNKRAFEKAVSAIEHCTANGITVVVESILVKESIKELPRIVDHLNKLGVKEWRIMRYVETGKNDHDYGVSAGETLPIMIMLDQYLADNDIEMNIGWPCSQNFCTTETKKSIAENDPTIAVRRKQIVNHCEAGVTWCSVSFDGKLRTCPHSNHYHGDVISTGIASGWKTMASKVSQVIADQSDHSECRNCAVLSSCKGGCHLENFFTPQ